MRHIGLSIFLLIAFQNCGNIDLVSTTTQPRVRIFSAFTPVARVSEQQAIAAHDGLLVGCQYSVLTLFDINSQTVLDSKNATDTCYDVAIIDGWVAMSTRSNTVRMFKIVNQELVATQIINKDNSSTSLSGFGESISLKSNLLIISDKFHGITANGREGAAYIYRRSGDIWSLESQLLSTDPNTTELFGHKVTSDGTSVYISARYDNFKGAVYVFDRNGADWQLTQKIEPPENIVDQQFGYSISVDENYLAVSAVAVAGTPSELSKGSVYIYKKNADWQYKQKIVSNLPMNEDFFGYQVSLSYPNLAISATQQFLTNGHGYVDIYTFQDETWFFNHKIDNAETTMFGLDLVLSENNLISIANSDLSNDTVFIYQQLAK